MDLDALEALPTWEWPAGADAIVAEVLRGSDREARLRAARLAGHLYHDEGTVALLTDIAAAEPDPEVRARAAVALGPALEDCDTSLGLPYGTEVSEATFERACQVLERVARDPALPKVVRRRALEGAVRAPRGWQEALIRRACGETDPEWRMTGVFCAARYPDLHGLALEALDDAELEVRIEAVRAVGEIGAREEVARLIRLVEARDTPPDLRLAAVGSLGEMGVSQAVPALTSLLSSDDADLADAAEAALEEIGLATAVEEDDSF